MGVNKNILYISYDGMTDVLGQSQVLPYLIGLSKRGYNIHLISFEKEDNFLKLKNDIFHLCQLLNISWYPQKYTKKPPILSTIWDIIKMKRAAKKLHKINHFKIVHCRSYIPGMIGMYLKRRFGVRFIFDMRGFWVDERVDGGQWDLNKFIYRKIYAYFKKKEIELFSSCDHCISLTENGKKELLTWKLDRDNILPIEVIPCCVDLSHFDYKKISTEEKAKYLKKYNIASDDLVICYLGSLSTVYMFDKVLKVVGEIEQKYPHFKFLIFTPENPDLVYDYILKSPIKRTEQIIIDSLARKNVPTALSICDYSIFFCKPSYCRKGTSPTRLAELIACGVKIISNSEIGDTELQIKENDLGYVFEGFRTVDFEKFINTFKLRKNFSKTKLFDAATKLFNLEEGIYKYSEIYNLNL